MILSRSFGFLFIKNKKTAGTSLEIALSRHCREGDIVTPIRTVHELWRYEHEGVLPRGFSVHPEVEELYRQAIRDGDRSAMAAARRAQTGRRFSNHMSARRVRQRIGQPTWSALFKFAVDRHPYEKAVSQAYYRFRQKAPDKDLPAHLDETVRAGRYRNFQRYTHKGQLLVDEVLRFEDLPGCLVPIEERLGLPSLAPLPTANSTQRRDRRPAREILSDEQKAIILEVCTDEMELLGYEP